ncbi:MAG: hypothetical protein LUQ65_10300 [Candidatus Helarchaeota archaeon]|nr:hypothetical protein [Candidatus Helarchaeota archaeon]
MRRKILIGLATIILLATIFGCGTMRKDIIAIVNEDVANAQTSREAAKKMLSVWLINSGFIRGGLGPARMGELPKGVVDAMDELDKLASKTEWTDFELGMSIGLRVRLLTEIVAQALKLYAPEVLKYIPMVF